MVPSPYSNTTNLSSIVPTPDFGNVTPSDTDTLSYGGVADSQCKGLRSSDVSMGGDITVINSVGDPITFTVAAGEVLTIQTKRVLATGTTAQAIVAYF